METSIVDNFLEQEEFDRLQDICLDEQLTSMEGDALPWFYNKNVVFDNETTGRFQFNHIFYERCNQISNFLPSLAPIVDRLKPLAIYRIKANLTTQVSNIIEYPEDYHIDFVEGTSNLELWTTSIFYVNTNNGYTKLKDGTIIESVANRLVSFPASTYHFGTPCTDEKVRVVINFNYTEK